MFLGRNTGHVSVRCGYTIINSIVCVSTIQQAVGGVWGLLDMGTATCLLEDDDGTVRLEGLFDLLRVLLRDALFEHLWHRLDKLLRLHRTKDSVKKKKGGGNTAIAK
jgi:hypothetical protein